MSQYMEIDGGTQVISPSGQRTRTMQWVVCDAAGTAPCRVCLGLLCSGEWETANFPGNFCSNVMKIPRMDKMLGEHGLG